MDYALPTVTPSGCQSSLSCFDWSSMRSAGGQMPALSSRSGTSDLFASLPLDKFLSSVTSRTGAAVCALAVKGSALATWSAIVSSRLATSAGQWSSSRRMRIGRELLIAVRLSPLQDKAPAWAQTLLTTVKVTGLMDTLTLFTKVPVQADQYYLTGMYIIGAPGFDFLMPVGSSGVAIAGAFNPCIG